MKKKILLLVLSVFCLAALIGGLFVANAAEAPATDIVGHNLSLDDSVQIIYYVYQTAPEGAETGVLCWYDPQENYTLENAQYKLSKSSAEIIDGKEYAKYAFSYLAAKMMSTDIYAVSYVKVGDTVTYSEPDKYSVLQYCYNKKDSTTIMGEGGTTLGELVAGILDYGALAQTFFRYNLDRLANANYYEISAVNGTLADGTKSGLFQAGELVTLNAPAEKDGVPFFSWKDETGATVGTEANMQITVGTTEKTFTAVYEEIVPEEPYNVKFMLDDTAAAIGEEFVVPLSVKSIDTAEVDGLIAYNLQYDKTVLEFVGFESYGSLITGSVAGANSVVAANHLINLGYSPAIVANGTICNLRFRVKNTVSADTQTTISMQVSASKNRQPLDTVIAPSCVATVTAQ
ncbi:MAG: hypothetical protein E7680_04925 [Ruminococcaceae bacterium]|nr:hypothetical protein [Oscillospiraceae bacterium]